MSWGASEAQPLSAAGQMPMPQMSMVMPTEDFGGNKDLMQELHMRAAREAALAVGMSPSAAMAAMPLLPTMPTGMPTGIDAVAHAEAVLGSEPLGMPSCSTSNDSCGQPEQLFTCTVCRKVFKREMNLIFHMTTHRPRQPEVEPTDSTSTQPVKCQDCGKEFATKYQAKKHFLRRHFQGEKPFACTKCNKKRFVVKEDLTMHMKSCGNVYVCNCGIRLCSLGALKRHCKYFGHEPESLEPQPDPVSSAPALGWNGLDAVSSVAAEAHSLSDGHPMHGLGMQNEMPSSSGGMSHPALAQTLAARYAAGLGLNGELAHQGQNRMAHQGGGLGGLGGGLGGLGSSQHEQALSAALASYQGMARLPGQQQPAGGGMPGGMPGGVGGGPIPQGLLSMGRGGLGAGAPVPGTAPYPVSSADEALPSNWPHMLNGMIPSLAHALRRQAGGIPGMENFPVRPGMPVPQPGPPNNAALGNLGGGVAAAALSAAVSAAFNGQYAAQHQRLEGDPSGIAAAGDAEAKRQRMV